jgi:hypothetical protein
LLFGLLAFTVSISCIAFANAVSAACVGSTCSLGGQLRVQGGFGGRHHPRPLSLSPVPDDGDFRWGQPGLIQATPSATVQQGPAGPGTPGTDPRSLMFVKPDLFTYDGPVAMANAAKSSSLVFAIQTNLGFQFPHPGTTGSGATAMNGPFSTQTFSAGGRTGPSVVSWCAGLFPPTATFNPGCAAPDAFGFATNTTAGGINVTRPLLNGLVRYTATRNQFGGAVRMRKTGTSVIFINVAQLSTGALPCTIGTNSLCILGPLSNPSLVTESAVGNAFGPRVSHPAFTAVTFVFEASIGENGTIHSIGAPVTDGMGNVLPHTGSAHTSWGVPGTTGRLTISVTQNREAPTDLETFTRTGGDHRTAGGEGIVVLVSGALSSRSISGPDAVRGWMTFDVPELGAGLSAAVALAALAGCQHWNRRRRRGRGSR